MRLITTTCASMFAAISLLAATPASASHLPVYEAANEYRAAVRLFERAVLRARCFDRHEERIVDRLEDATSRLRSAARHPEHLHRLQVTWNEIRSLQQLVAQTIFGHPLCPAGGELVICWDKVVHTGAIFAQQLALIQCDVLPRYGVPILPIYGIPHPHHHPWYPGPSPYCQEISENPKTDRVIHAPTREPRDYADIRKLTPTRQISREVQIQRTLNVPSPSGIGGTPSQRTIGSAKTGAKLMRR